MFKRTLFKDGPRDDKGNLLQRLQTLVSSTDDLYLRQTEHECPWCAGLSMVPTSYCPRDVTRYDCAWRRQAVIWDEHTAGLYIKLERKSDLKYLGQITHTFELLISSQ